MFKMDPKYIWIKRSPLILVIGLAIGFLTLALYSVASASNAERPVLKEVRDPDNDQWVCKKAGFSNCKFAKGTNPCKDAGGSHPSTGSQQNVCGWIADSCGCNKAYKTVPDNTPVPTNTPIPPTPTPAPAPKPPPPPKPDDDPRPAPKPPSPSVRVEPTAIPFEALECFTVEEWERRDLHWAHREINWALKNEVLFPQDFNDDGEPKFCAKSFLIWRVLGTSSSTILTMGKEYQIPEYPEYFFFDLKVGDPDGAAIEEVSIRMCSGDGLYTEKFWFKPFGLPNGRYFGPDRNVTFGELTEWQRLMIQGPNSEPGEFEGLFKADPEMVNSHKFSRSSEEFVRIEAYDFDGGPLVGSPNRFVFMDQYAVLAYRISVLMQDSDFQCVPPPVTPTPTPSLTPSPTQRH